MIWLVVALAYAVGGWATLAFFAHVAAVDPKTYLPSDFWLFLVLSLVWPVSWALAAGVYVSLTGLSVIHSIWRKRK